MPQFGEPIKTPVAHTEPNDECPFCPPPDRADYTTFPGEKNNSKKLSGIMESPSKLTSAQAGARPQTGRADSDGYIQEQDTLAPREKDDFKEYTFQAHHLISGIQALQGSPMEDWILYSRRNEKDTGYSVNSTGNGFWAPSVPKRFMGKWGAAKKILTDQERQTEAEAVMKDARAQIHISPHNITDKDDPNGDKHMSYDRYIKDYLDSLSFHVNAWVNVCYFCEEKKNNNKKPQANYTVHTLLDMFSAHLQREISGARNN